MLDGESLLFGGQSHQAVGEVIIVDQRQVVGHACQFSDVGARAGDVGFDLVGALEAGVDKRIQPDANAVRAKGIGFLHNREPLVGDLRVQTRNTRGAQPLLGPIRQVAPRGVLQGCKQVIEGCVGKGVIIKVAAYPGKELLIAHIGLQLFEYACPLGVGDAVKVLLSGFNIWRISGDRVGRR